MFRTKPSARGATPRGEIGVVMQPRLIVEPVVRADTSIVLTVPAGQPETLVGALSPDEARAFAKLLNAGADLIDPDGSPERAFEQVFNHPTARGRFKEGMSIAREIFR